MKIVYHATNSLEAHIIRGLLEQQNIPAYVHGEHLQSGAGEIPPTGLVKVNVNDEDYDSAKKFILDWDKVENTTSKAATESKGSDQVNTHLNKNIFMFIIVLLLSIIAVLLFRA